MDDKEAREAEAADAACETPQEGEAYQEDQVETLEGDVSLDEEAVGPGMGRLRRRGRRFWMTTSATGSWRPREESCFRSPKKI